MILEPLELFSGFSLSREANKRYRKYLYITATDVHDGFVFGRRLVNLMNNEGWKIVKPVI